MTKHRKAENSNLITGYDHALYSAELIDSVSDAIISSDIQGFILSWNKAAEMLYGWIAKDSIGRKVVELLQTEYPDNHDHSSVLKEINEKGKWEGKLVQRKKNGEKIVVAATCISIKDKTGKLVGGISIIHEDLTERKKIKEQLRDANANFSALFNNQLVGLTYCQTISNENNQPVDFIFMDVNAAYERIVGVDRSKLLGRKVTEAFPGVSKDLIYKHNKVSLTGEESHFEIYEPTVNMWFDVHVFSPAKGYFMALFYDTTDRRKTEQALRETRDLQSAILKNTHVSIACLDRDFNFIVVNEIYAKSDGRKPDFFVGKNHFSLFPNADNEAIFRRVADTGEAYYAWAKPFVYAEHPERGTSYWDWSLKPVMDASGKVTMLVLTLLDVTARVEAEESLRESEKRFRQLADAMPQLVWTANPGGTVDYYNERYKEFDGNTIEDKGYWHWDLIIHEDDIAPTLKAWRYAVENGSDYQMEHRVKMKSGIYKWHLSRAIPIHDSAGRIIKWYGTTTDIDDSKKAGDELANSKKKLDLALENANIGIWELNVSTSETFMDEKSEKMFGLEPGSFDRTLTGFEKLVHEEDLDHVRKSITDTLHHQLPFQTIFRTRPVHGTIRYISSRAMVTEDEKGKILTLTGVNFDITELKQGTENLISRLNMDLLRSNSDLQQFAYVASHDLQEPLRTISSFTQLLQKKYADKLDQDANEYINYAVNGSKRMYELINGLLSYSRIQTRASALSSASMESVLRKVKENLYLLITETKAEVTNDELPQVTVDENQMIQVLQNLIENGIKFCKGIPRIHISAEAKAGMYIFSVKDNGIGIEKQYYDKIFRIFQKLHSHQEYNGTGIGLALCKRIVERHGGEIWVESEPYQGSVFYFTLPEISPKDVS